MPTCGKSYFDRSISKPAWCRIPSRLLPDVTATILACFSFNSKVISDPSSRDPLTVNNRTRPFWFVDPRLHPWSRLQFQFFLHWPKPQENLSLKQYGSLIRQDEFSRQAIFYYFHGRNAPALFTCSKKISYVYSNIGLNDFYGHFEIVKSKHLSHFRSFTHGLNPFPLFYRWQLWTKKSNMESRTGNKELRHGPCHTGQSDTAWLSLI